MDTERLKRHIQKWGGDFEPATKDELAVMAELMMDPDTPATHSPYLTPLEPGVYGNTAAPPVDEPMPTVGHIMPVFEMAETPPSVMNMKQSTVTVDSPTPGGWIAWHGGECPVAPETLVEVELRNGELYTRMAIYFRWNHIVGFSSAFDIIRYRIVEPVPVGEGPITSPFTSDRNPPTLPTPDELVSAFARLPFVYSKAQTEIDRDIFAAAVRQFTHAYELLYSETDAGFGIEELTEDRADIHAAAHITAAKVEGMNG